MRNEARRNPVTCSFRILLLVAGVAAAGVSGADHDGEEGRGGAEERRWVTLPEATVRSLDPDVDRLARDLIYSVAERRERAPRGEPARPATPAPSLDLRDLDGLLLAGGTPR